MNLEDLKSFLRESVVHTYAGNGKEVKSQRPGFIELEYQKGDWYLRDSYAGHFQAPGMTVVYFQDKPVWTYAYSGKTIKEYYDRTNEIFSFLKSAMLEKDLKEANDLPVRGPSEYLQNEWKYTFDFEGDMNCFYAREKIFLKNELVFFQDIIGGLVISRNA
ncbi:MAG: DUF5680 domain-containing protein [Patescibacteria group bacterium]